MECLLRKNNYVKLKTTQCLNPYSNGMLTQNKGLYECVFNRVLILILMECLLRMNQKQFQKMSIVLILILMECLLSVSDKIRTHPLFCLNPYSNGMLTQFSTWGKRILHLSCLNPYSNGMLTQLNPSLHLNTPLSLNPYSNGMLTQHIRPNGEPRRDQS